MGLELALGEVPERNGYWLDDRHQPREAINIGFAISLRQGGLITPAILSADLKNLDELMEALRDLVVRARSGGLRSSEMTDATVSVTSLGDLGVEAVYGVIYPPQVVLAGFGKVTEQPWAENGMLAVRPVLTATLSGDHRATDGPAAPSSSTLSIATCRSQRSYERRADHNGERTCASQPPSFRQGSSRNPGLLKSLDPIQKHAGVTVCLAFHRNAWGNDGKCSPHFTHAKFTNE